MSFKEEKSKDLNETWLRKGFMTTKTLTKASYATKLAFETREYSEHHMSPTASSKLGSHWEAHPPKEKGRRQKSYYNSITRVREKNVGFQ